MLRFVAVFRTAHETLMDSEKDLVDAAAAAEAIASSAAATPDVQVSIGTPDVQVSIGFSGLAFGSSLSQSSSSGETAASDTGGSAEEEEELWDKLCELDVEQLTAVMEDAGAVLWSDGTFFAWLRWRRKFDLCSRATNTILQEEEYWRRFVPDYADIFAAVDRWMDEREGVGFWDRGGWRLMDFLGEVRSWATIVLMNYEITFGFLPYVLSLELSGWARYNLWAYLVLHSAAFFKIIWMFLSADFISVKDESLWNGNFAETDFLLVSIAVLVRTRRQNPSSFQRLSLLNILRDARCVHAVDANNLGVNSLIASECPHGTAGRESIPILAGTGIWLASEPEPNSPNPQPSTQLLNVEPQTPNPKPLIRWAPPATASIDPVADQAAQIQAAVGPSHLKRSS